CIAPTGILHRKPQIESLQRSAMKRREENMNLRRRNFLLVVTLAAAAATPALAQAPTVGPANSGEESAANFSGMWVHGSIPGFEPLASGPTSLVNRSRLTTAQLL